MTTFNRYWLLARTLPRLGWRQVAAIAWYRLSLRAGWRRGAGRADRPYPAGACFHPCASRPDYPAAWRAALFQEADRIVAGELRYFFRHWQPAGLPPKWFRDPFSGKEVLRPLEHWTRVDEFTLDGDIKIIWEPSRFGWALTLARAYAVSGKELYLNTLNNGIGDWIRENPAGFGPNWKCGQECAIRLLHILLAAYLLRQHLQPSAVLVRFVAEHAGRVAANIGYALAQDNNHATSEAAALLVAGAWLGRVAPPAERLARRAGQWQRQGRALLEKTVRRLVADDGTFSQYSVNYQRVLLDTIGLALFWQKTLELPPFSAAWLDKAGRALDWLGQLVDPVSGAAPNLGGNDGAMLWPLHAGDYGDYRPARQLAAALIRGHCELHNLPGDEQLYWLDLRPQARAAAAGGQRNSWHFADGGFVVLRGRTSWALLRYPRFRFRPAQADALHLDLWKDARNILRDAGSYSYHCPEPWQSYFPSVPAHNTAQFDEHDQMPRLGRFLYGAWLRPESVGALQATAGGASWQGSYRDAWKCRHRRSVSVCEDRWTITDELDGYRQAAVLRWHLIPADWRLEGTRLICDRMALNIDGSPAPRTSLAVGWESRYYYEKADVPVLEIKCAPPRARVVTEIVFR
jgi:hypothetical protein